MSSICQIYNDFTEHTQMYLQEKYPSIPSDFVDTSVLSFGIGATACVILSGGNPVFGLIGGSLSVVACIVDACFQSLLQKLRDNQKINKNEKFLAHVMCYASLLTGLKVIGLPIHVIGSVVLTLPFFYIGYHRTEE